MKASVFIIKIIITLLLLVIINCRNSKKCKFLANHCKIRIFEDIQNGDDIRRFICRSLKASFAFDLNEALAIINCHSKEIYYENRIYFSLNRRSIFDDSTDVINAVRFFSIPPLRD